MLLIDLVKKESEGQRGVIALAVVASAASNAAILIIINSAVKTASWESLNFQLLVMFALAIGIYIAGLKFTLDRSARIFENMIHRIRTRLIAKLAASELIAVEQIGKAEIYKRLTQETTVISESQALLTAALHAAIMVAFTAIYVFTLSPIAFVTILVIVLAGISIYRGKEVVVRESFKRTIGTEIRFFGVATHLIDGLKEVKMSSRRGDELGAELTAISRTVRDQKLRTISVYNDTSIFSQCFFYVLIGTIVFLLPRISATYGAVISQLVAAVLFMMGPLSSVVSALPALSKANMAAESIHVLEHKIDEMFGHHRPASTRKRDVQPISFEQDIELQDLEFTYPDPSGAGAFSIGPVSFTIRKGEVIFIIGGNGSGKSTLMKLLTGLYRPNSGAVKVDGRALNWGEIQRYRELFSVIFADFHLFEKLYGAAVDEEKVASLLRLMDIFGKTRYTNGKFTTLELSTGQRKRLALVSLLLENRSIAVFDEWAADQDPEFRKYFYEVLLHDLKRQGKTVIAITHDDHYFQHCDKLIKMDLGTVEFVQDIANRAPGH